MANYHKNKLINKALETYYETFSRTLDTADFVPEKYNDKILLYIFKNMRRTFRQIDREERKYQKAQRRKQKQRQKTTASAASVTPKGTTAARNEQSDRGDPVAPK